jgi:hypothetical protein
VGKPEGKKQIRRPNSERKMSKLISEEFYWVIWITMRSSGEFL